jgi:hypothetical protein
LDDARYFGKVTKFWLIFQSTVFLIGDKPVDPNGVELFVEHFSVDGLM